MSRMIRTTVVLAVVLVTFLAPTASSPLAAERPEVLDARLRALVETLPDVGALDVDRATGRAELPDRTTTLLDAFEGTFVVERDATVPLIDVILRADASDASIGARGATVLGRVGDIVAARVPIDRLDDITTVSGVRSIEPSGYVETLNDNGSVDAGIVTTLEDLGYDGTGVVVGIVDTGIDFFHDDFRNPDGATRVKWLLDWTIDGTGPGGGTVYSEAQINAELASPGSTVPSRDIDGHGTHVAGTAAGDGSASNGSSVAAGTYRGVAPGADLVIVKAGNGSFPTSAVITGLQFIQQKATTLDQPWVANLSLGTVWGPHDGTNAMDQAVDYLTGASRTGAAIVAAAGNDGSASYTANGIFSSVSGGYAPTGTVPDGAYDAIIDVWYPGEITDLSISYSAPGGLTADGLEVDDPSSHTNCTAPSGPRLCVSVFHAQSLQNGDNFLEVWVSGYEGETIPGGTLEIDFELPSGAFHWIGQSFNAPFTQPSSAYSVGHPGSARNAITVGAHVTRNSWTADSGQLRSTGYTLGDIAGFSSRGPTRDGRLKPEITAPGSAIISSASEAAGWSSSSVMPGGLHAPLSGTSMAAPHVTGVTALLMQAFPEESSEVLRLRLTESATSDGFTGDGANSTWGRGKLNAPGALCPETLPEGLAPQAGPCENARIEGNLTDDAVALYGFRANEPVDVAITNDSAVEVYADTVTTDADGWALLTVDDHGQDLAAGWTITAAGLSDDQALELADLALLTPDVDTETVAGTLVGPGTVDVSVFSPGATSPTDTVEGIAPAAGTFEADFTGTADIAAGWSGLASHADGDGDLTLAASEVDPLTARIGVDLAGDVVIGTDFEADSTASVRILEQPGGLTLFEGNLGTGGGDFTAPADVHGLDLVPGMEIEVIDGAAKSIVPVSISIDPPDIDADILSGTASPDVDVTVHIFAPGEPMPEHTTTVTADGEGAWTADVSGVVDIDWYWEFLAEVYEDDGDYTRSGRGTPAVVGDITQDLLYGNGWGSATTVDVEVLDAPEGESLFLDSITTDGSGFFRLLASELDVDLEAGMQIVVTEDGGPKAVTLLDLVVTDIDEDTESVSGTAPVGADVVVSAISSGGSFLAGTSVVADGSGDWAADLSATDLEPGVTILVRIYDSEQDRTEAISRLGDASSYIEVDLSQQYFYLSGFSSNATYDYVIRATAGGSVLTSGSLETDNTGWVFESVAGLADLEPGVEIVISGDIIKRLVLADISLAELDPEDDIVIGTAPPSSTVSVFLAAETGTPEFEATADGSGDWSFDFGAEGIDFTWDHRAYASVEDADGDSSRVSRDAPRISGRLGELPFGFGFLPETNVAVQIRSEPDGADLSDDSELTDEAGRFYLPLEFTLEPGFEITVTDGTHTKVVELLDLTIVTVDDIADVATGTAPPGTELHVAAFPEGGGYSPIVPALADEDGAWIVDLGAEGIDVEPGWDVHASSFDHDGDSTDITHTVSTTCTDASLEITPRGPQEVGTELLLAAAAEGCSNAEYQFWINDGGWQSLTDGYASASTFVLDTSGRTVGTKTFSVWVRQQGAGGTFQAEELDTFELTPSTAPACTDVTLSVDPASPQSVGTPLTLSAVADDCPSPEFQYWLWRHNGGWSVARPYGADAEFVLDTSELTPGPHHIEVWARQSGRLDAPAQDRHSSYTLLTGVCTDVTLSITQSSPQAIGSTLDLSAEADGCGSPQFQFWRWSAGGGWQVVQAYSGDDTLSLDTSGYPASSYIFVVWARSGGSGNFDVEDRISNYQLTEADTVCGDVTLSITQASPQAVGTTLDLSAEATGCDAPEYQFWRWSAGGGWQVIQAYSGDDTLSLDTEGYPASTYIFAVWARGGGSVNFDVEDRISDYHLTALGGSCADVSLAVTPDAPHEAGEPITLSAESEGCGSPEYQFWHYDPLVGWEVVQAWSADDDVTLDTTDFSNGTHRFSVWASQPGAWSLQAEDIATAAVSKPVPETTCTDASLAADQPLTDPIPLGTTLTLEAGASGCDSPQFQFWLWQPSTGWEVIQPYSATNTAPLDTSALAASNYRLSVWVRETGSTSTLEAEAVTTIHVE